MFAAILYGILGLIVGILINRAADNLPPPARRSMISVPHCAYCNSPRLPVEQSGLLSFLMRREYCHSCGAPLPLRAPFVEIACGVLFAFLWEHYGPGLVLCLYSFFTAVLVLIAAIDLEHKLILNIVVLPATALALLASPITLATQFQNSGETPQFLFLLSLLGAVAAYVIVFGIYLFGLLFVRILRRARTQNADDIAFGLGDVKLAGFAGALVGFPTIIYVLIYGIVLGGIGAVIVLVGQYVATRKFNTLAAIPYGPFFIIAAWVFMIWGTDALRAVTF